MSMIFDCFFYSLNIFIERENEDKELNEAQKNSSNNRGTGKRSTIPTSEALHQKSFLLMEKAEKYMELLGLSCHWHPNDPEYIEARKVQQNHQFRAAVDHLEKLVVC